jgi:hypothetical protein
MTEKSLQYHRDWRRNNKERVHSYYETRKEHIKQYRKDNMESIRVANRKRRELKKASGIPSWNQLNRDKNRNSALLRRYNITLDEYNQILSNQDNKCAICKKEQSTNGRALHVDHCHTTGTVRGLLCYECNSLLGYARDNATILNQAVQYLDESNSNN